MVATKLPKNLQVYDCSIISETRLITRQMLKVSLGVILSVIICAY